jgi:5-hydroxyisourate hydrolase-like protein (transthyretin family)
VRRCGRGVFAAPILAIAAAILGFATAAAGDTVDSLRPANLRVAGGEGWHAENDFRLDWDLLGGPPAAVFHEVHDAAGNFVAGAYLPWKENLIEHIHVPRPGRYTAHLWLVGADGLSGVHADAVLLFDDRPPRPVQALGPGGWLGGGVPAVVEIEHPAPPQPVSGIRGYAISVERGSGALPCQGRDRCSEAETQLGGGIDDDTISLGLLPEGTNSVHVVAVSGSGMRSEGVGTTTLRVDASAPEIALRGVPTGWATGPVQLTAVATDSLSGMGPSGPDGPFTAIAIDAGVPAVAPGGSVTTTVTGDGPHRIAFYARDAAGNGGEGEGALPPPRSAVVRIDEGPPGVAFARVQDPSEPERIETTVVDQLSGPSAERGSIAVRPTGTRQQFAAIPTRVSPGKLVAHWDSDAVPAGTYEFKAIGYDAAGNSSAADRRLNETRMILQSPLKALTSIQDGFGGKRLVWHRCKRVEGRRQCRAEAIGSFAQRPATRSIPYGRGTRFAGLLGFAGGSPLAGVPVQVVETFDAGASQAQRTTTVATAEDGSFVAHLAPGPSRQVEALFAGNRVLTRASGRRVRLNVLSGVSVRASTATALIGGPPVVFSGRIGDLDASIPSSGRPVQLQFRLQGKPWSEFRTVQTDAQGRFRYAYSFSDDDSRGVSFQFRAFVPAQAGWPYEPGASRPVFVTGR